MDVENPTGRFSEACQALPTAPSTLEAQLAHCDRPTGCVPWLKTLSLRRPRRLLSFRPTDGNSAQYYALICTDDIFLSAAETLTQNCTGPLASPFWETKVTTKKVNTVKRCQAPPEWVPWLIGAGVVALIAHPHRDQHLAARNRPLPGGGIFLIEESNSYRPTATPPTNCAPIHPPQVHTVVSKMGKLRLCGTRPRLVPYNLSGGVILWYTLGSREEDRRMPASSREVARGFKEGSYRTMTRTWRTPLLPRPETPALQA